MNPTSPHNLYFLGIGGIGMSALARHFHRQGKQVSGYDRTTSPVTEQLTAMGMEVFHDINPARIEAADWIIYTPAIPQDHPERIAAEGSGKPFLKRAEVLGLISAEYRTLAVAGTHGKTTTSTMLAHVLHHVGVAPTAFLGGLSNNLGGNFLHGESPWVVVEADEYDRSFMQLHPEWAVINSLDPDHLDIYGDEAEMHATYQAFAQQAKHLLIHHSVAAQAWELPSKTFGVEATCDYRAENLQFEGLHTTFDFVHPGGVVEGLPLSMPGLHNVLNMTAALAIAVEIGVAPEVLPDCVATFTGIYRRYEVKVHSPELTLIDDYAHHPAELAATIETTRRLFPDRKLVGIFQPHLFSRTRDFMEEFAQVLSQVDVLLLMEIYPARELPIPGITSYALLGQIPLAEKALVAREDLSQTLTKHLSSPTTVLTLGAGDIDKEVPRLTAFLQPLASS